MTAERIQASRVAEITGYSLRTIQMMAAAGELPSAMRRKAGSRWTFDEATIRRWVKQREDAACRGISIAAAPSGGAEFKLGAASIDEAYARLLARKPSSASRRSATR